jgi:hypothetical protein
MPLAQEVRPELRPTCAGGFPRRVNLLKIRSLDSGSMELQKQLKVRGPFVDVHSDWLI